MRTERTNSAPLWQVFALQGVLPRMAIWAVLWGLGVLGVAHLWGLAVLFLCDLGLFLWQLRRYGQATETHLRAYGAMAAVWGGYLGFLFFAAFSTTLWWGLILNALTPQDGEAYADQMERLRRETYDLYVSDDGQAMVFSGDITFGLTKRFNALMTDNPAISQVTLTSTGGHVYEARGVAALILRHNLDTLAIGDCSSACTLLFMAGKDRRLAPEARLGFHQYALNFPSVLPSVDLQREQQTDRQFFRKRGVSEAFIDQAFAQTSTEMWFPDRATQRAAGILRP